MNINQLLSDTGLNPFAATLLAESWDKLSAETKDVIPSPLVFTIGNCTIGLCDSQKNIEGVPVQPGNSQSDAIAALRDLVTNIESARENGDEMMLFSPEMLSAYGRAKDVLQHAHV